MYTLSLTSALDGVGSQRHATNATTPRGVRKGAESLAPTGIRSPDRPVRSESLHRLSYLGSYSTSQPIHMHV
jgi:hypothetical protein